MAAVWYCSVVLLVLVYTSQSGAVVKRDVETEEDERAYLRQFGYLSDTGAASEIASYIEDPFKEAIRRFQHMAGIDETGVIDEKTKEMMNMPRCGIRDNDDMSSIAKRRRKRYALHSKWGKRSLTWRLSTPGQDLSRSAQRAEIRRALEVWSKYTPLRFRETTGFPDINIKFVRGDHGDGYTFDGRGRTLAHAFFPSSGGDAHFDEDELFTMNTYDGTNLFQVAAHEFGHSLGLSHSDVRNALMAPFYRGYQPNFRLDSDDIRGIQALYGSNPNPDATTPTTTPRPTITPRTTTTPRPTITPRTTITRSPVTQTPGPMPDTCQSTAAFDAMTIYEGNTYRFKGDLVYQLTRTGVASGWPRRLANTVFHELPANLDAALHWEASSLGPARTYFFKGAWFWRYETYGLVRGYPKRIAERFGGLPDDIDSAFVWGRNGRTYFIKGDEYYRYARGRGIDAGYPRPLSVWRGLPSRVDAAFVWPVNKKTYFFRGENYYRFNDIDFKVDSSYPRSSAYWWMGCRTNNVQDGSDSPLDTEQMDGKDDQMIPIVYQDPDMPSDLPPSGQAALSATISLLVAMITSHVLY